MSDFASIQIDPVRILNEKSNLSYQCYFRFLMNSIFPDSQDLLAPLSPGQSKTRTSVIKRNPSPGGDRVNKRNASKLEFM